MGLKVVNSFREHFEALIIEGSSKLQISIPESTRRYILDVLETNSQMQGPLWNPDFLASRWWLEAQNSQYPQEKMERLKLLADHLMYMIGIFSEHFQRKLVDVTFYRDLSQLSFKQLAQLTPSDLARKTYLDLGHNLPQYVEVLNWLALQSGLNSSSNTLHLYEAFLKTGSEAAYQILVDQGVVVPPNHVLKKTDQR